MKKNEFLGEASILDPIPLENKHTGSTFDSFVKDEGLELSASADLTMQTILDAKDQMNNLEVPEVKETKPELDKDEEAAIFINQAHKEFRRLAFSLADRKKHSVSRVLEAVLFEPLEEVKLQGKAEEDLFAICKEVLYNKGVVLQYAYNQIEESKKEKENG